MVNSHSLGMHIQVRPQMVHCRVMRLTALGFWLALVVGRGLLSQLPFFSGENVEATNGGGNPARVFNFGTTSYHLLGIIPTLPQPIQ